MEYVYSLSEDEFMDIDAITDEIDETNSEEDNIKVTHVYRGEKVPQYHADFFDVDSLIEDMTNRAYDNFDEHSDNYCNNLEDKKHALNLQKVILDYLNENVKQPDFYSVENVQKITVEEIE